MWTSDFDTEEERMHTHATRLPVQARFGSSFLVVS